MDFTPDALPKLVEFINHSLIFALNWSPKRPNALEEMIH